MVHRATVESFSSTSSLLRHFLILAAVTTVAAGSTTAYVLWKSKPAQEGTATAQASLPQIQTVTALGRLEPQGEAIALSAASSTDGNRIDQLFVQEGDWVKAGQVIAVLDNRDRLQAALEQAQEQVRVAQAKLATVQAGAKTGEIAAQQATIARLQVDRRTEIAAQQATIARLEVDRRTEIAAQEATISRLEAEKLGEIEAQQATIARLTAQLRNDQIEAQRYEDLYQEGAIATQQRDSKRLALETAQQRLTEAQVSLTRIRASRQQQINEANAKLSQIQASRQQQINEANAKLSQIQASRQQQINEASATLDRIVEVRPVDIQTAEAEIKAARANMKQAQANLDLAYIRAPKDAQVLKVYAYPGERINTEGIVQLGQTRQMYAVAEVYESDITKVRIGQSVTLTSDSFQGELKGTVERIGLQVQRQNVINTDPSANIDNRIVEVKVRLDEAASQKVAGLTNLQVKVAIGK